MGVMSVSDDGQPEAEQPDVQEPVVAEQPTVLEGPVVTYVDGEPVVTYAPAVDGEATPPFGFPLPPDVPKPRRSYRKVWRSLLAAVLAVVVVAVGYTVVRYLVDNSTYGDAHAAYQKADCATAIGQFDDVITAWRIVKLGDTVARAESEKAECVVFHEAVKRQQAGNTPGALTSYATFIPGRPPSPLVDAARSRIGELFKQPEPAKLATVESCDTLPVLRDQKLLDPASAPTFLASCGGAYVKGGDRPKAITAYTRLFADFSTDKVAADTEAELLKDAGWCLELDKFRNDPVLSALKDLVPGLLATCAKAPTTPESVAIEEAQEFLKKFPGHRFAADVLATFAALLNKQARTDGGYKDFGAEDLVGPVGGDRAIIMVFNDSQEKLRIALSGPEPRVEELDPCADCPSVPKDTSPGGCRKGATAKRIVLAPGEYDMALDFSGGDRKTNGAFAHWALQGGKQYYGCFYISEATG
jgi:hypothetical protein